MFGRFAGVAAVAVLISASFASQSVAGLGGLTRSSGNEIKNNFVGSSSRGHVSLVPILFCKVDPASWPEFRGL